METTMDQTDERSYALAKQREEEKKQALAKEQGLPKHEPISKKMFWWILALCAFLDAVDAITGGTIGWFIGIVGDGIILIITWKQKSSKKQFKKMLAAAGAEKIWPLNMLPVRTPMWIWSYFSSKSKLLSSVADKL